LSSVTCFTFPPMRSLRTRRQGEVRSPRVPASGQRSSDIHASSVSRLQEKTITLQKYYGTTFEAENTDYINQ
jgi:hypothetical protein